MRARVNGVAVQVFRAPFRGANPGHVKTLKRPLKVDDLPVASLPDLLASKLDVLEQRLHQMRRSHDDETGPEPPDRTRQFGLTTTFDELVTAHNRSLGAPAKRNKPAPAHRQ